MTIAATTVIAKVEAGVTKVVNATMDGVVTGVDLHNHVLLVPMDRLVNTVALLPAPWVLVDCVLVDVRVLPVTKAPIVKTTSTTAPMSRAVATATASTETTRSHATVSQDLAATVVKWI